MQKSINLQFTKVVYTKINAKKLVYGYMDKINFYKKNIFFPSYFIVLPCLVPHPFSVFLFHLDLLRYLCPLPKPCLKTCSCSALLFLNGFYFGDTVLTGKILHRRSMDLDHFLINRHTMFAQKPTQHAQLRWRWRWF